jgi:hypothetical protein
MRARSRLAVFVSVGAGLGALVWAVPAAAAPAELFSSSTPAFTSSSPVPAGICFVTITADGGHGGGGEGDNGGKGASVIARVPVTPGETLAVQVGGAGTDGTDVTAPSQGGIGGGGGGTIFDDGGGAGASAVSDSSGVLVVAGGGGGGGPGDLGGLGGDAGTLTTAAGTGVGLAPGSGAVYGGSGATGAGGAGGTFNPVDDIFFGGGGGGGVTAGGGGPGGTSGGGGGGGDGTVGGGGGGAGTSLGGGAGGNGGTGNDVGQSGSGGVGFASGGTGNDSGGDGGSGPPIFSGAGGGGGGGIGFGGGGGGMLDGGGGGAGYGGGGGGAIGGGGGGSSFAAPSATSTSSSASTRTGDGQVTIAYDPATDACPTGTVVIAKLTVGGNATFSFAGDAPIGSQHVVTSGGSGEVSVEVPTGTYVVRETGLPIGWEFTSLVCSDATDASGRSTTAGNVATVDVQPSETVTCTWTNTKDDPDDEHRGTASRVAPATSSAPVAVEVAPSFTG